MKEWELLGKIIKDIMEEKPEIVLDAICDFHKYRTCEAIIIEDWIEYLEKEYKINFDKISEAKGLTWQVYENKASELAHLKREAKEYLVLKIELRKES